MPFMSSLVENPTEETLEASETITEDNFKDILVGALVFPCDFSCRIHSGNPVGSENIKYKMDCAIKHFS